MITILCATRNRPKQFARMAESALATAYDKSNVTIAFYTGDADPAFEDYRVPDNAYRYAGPDWPGVHALNYLWQAENNQRPAKLYMICADDAIFTTPHWDKALLNHYDALNNKIHAYSLLDSRDADGTPHPIVTKEFADTLGYVACPIFLHWNIDVWITEMAKRNQCFTHMKDYLLVHDKPSDTGQGDDTHNRIRNMGWHRRDAFVNQACQHYLDLDRLKIHWAMTQKEAA